MNCRESAGGIFRPKGTTMRFGARGPDMGPFGRPEIVPAENFERISSRR
jgi:hypothetical protein